MSTTGPTRPQTVALNGPLETGIDRYFEISLLAMLVTGFVALAGTGKLDPVSLLFVLVALGVRTYRLVTKRSGALSEKVTTRLTIGYVAFYPFDFYLLSGSFVSATVHLVLFIMVVKMFSVQRERDHLYLAIIAFLMILSAAVLTVDSFFLGAFCVFLLLAVSTFISMEMRRALAAVRKQAGHSANGDTQSATSDAALLGTSSGIPAQLPRKLAKSLSGTSALLVTGTVLGAAVIFFILPRLSTGYLTNLAARNTFVSGFSDEVKLGAIGRIQQSDSVVMHVKFAENNQVPVPADLKFKAVTLGKFDGKRWFNDRAEMKVIIVRAPFGQMNLVRSGIGYRINGTTQLISLNHGPLGYHVVMQPIGTNAFFLIPRPISLETDARDFTIDGGGSVGLNDPTRQITYYQGQSIISEPSLEERQSSSRDFPTEIAATYTQLPEKLDARIPQLARQISGNSTSAYEKARAIEGYLQSSGNYGYTLDLLGPADQLGDPLAHFLFETKKGHCEYFASAMAIMLRTQGIPARIANGFRGGELNDISGSYIVRARDAHSWVEVFIPSFGWATFDPTPPASSAYKGGWARVLLYVDAMREFWSEWVINYDHAHQTTLGETTVTRTRELYDDYRLKLKETYRHLLDNLRRTQRLASGHPQKFGMLGALLLLLIIIVVSAKKMLRYLRMMRISRSPAKSPAHAASIWYERMTRLLLRRRGIAKHPAQTPEEFLRTIDEDDIRQSVSSFTHHYERARFGGSADDASKLPQLYDDVEELVKR